MSELVPLGLFAVAVAVAAAVGIRLGMLLAPRIDRMTQRDDEDQRGDD